MTPPQTRRYYERSNNQTNRKRVPTEDGQTIRQRNSAVVIWSATESFLLRFVFKDLVAESYNSSKQQKQMY
jgi:hypothetical protein